MSQPASVAIIRDQVDPVASTRPVAWAETQLSEALANHGLGVARVASLEQAPLDAVRVVLAGFDAPITRTAFQRLSGTPVPHAPESLALMPLGPNGVLAAGADPRGLAYAALELADRVATAVDDPLAALRLDRPRIQAPANPIRGVARLFASDIEDLAWFRDPQFWRRYLSMLARYRFNRIHLAFGMGHDFLRNVVDAYLLFAYPFLVDVPGYDVGVPGLSAAERARNLEALRIASDEAAAHGLHFQLGIWTQAYEWVASPNANYVIEGLTPVNHAPYCRDAIRSVLEACPSIAGVTFRVHGESGVPEGNFEFWREVFRGLTSCGRRVELDMHPKGLGPEMLQVGLETGLPVTLSPKYTAEHMGLPGHQVAIREIERLPDGEEDPDAFRDHLMNQSAAGLRYTRYGTADFLREDRRYGVFYRIWPGTQRFLLWGDPALAAGYGRFGSFCGSLGIELCEPLSFKGRRGSGGRGGREGYADPSLRADGGTDWEKFDITYRLFGRLLYDPAEETSVWRRSLAHDFGADAAEHTETALGSASRILPFITSAYHPSAANNRYWPEIYTNLPIADEHRPHPYRDTPRPRRFGSASPLDPGLFVGVDEFVRETLAGRSSGRLSPVRVAARLDGLADTALGALARAEASNRAVDSARFRRLAADVRIQAGLGRFFAAKLRAGVAYSLYEATTDRARLRQAYEAYTEARDAWRGVVDRASVYRSDLTVGGEAWLRGHWSDRLEAIDADLADIGAEWGRCAGAGSLPAAAPLSELDPLPPRATYDHLPPTAFVRGEALRLALRWVDRGPGRRVEVQYRHVNQAEQYVSQPMVPTSEGPLEATIPSSYTDSPFPPQYFFVLRDGAHAWRHPDLDADLANQAYFLVRQRGPSAS